METVYQVIESDGFVEVCVRLIEPQDDILENVVGPLVSVNSSSVYIPNGAVLAS